MTSWRAALWVGAVLINLGIVCLVLVGRSGWFHSGMVATVLGVALIPHIYTAMLADGLIRDVWPTIPYAVVTPVVWLAVLPVSYF